jgi:hypothetical protein
MRALLGAALLLLACSANNNRGEGAECVSSQQCAAGLLCDFSKTPHVCAKNGTLRPEDMSAEPPDMTVPPDFAGADLLGVDMTAVVPPDMKVVVPADMTQLMDLSGPD